MQQIRETFQSFISEQVGTNWTFAQNPLIVVILILVVFYWILAILWTIKDISSRTNSLFGQILSILLVGV